MNQSTKTCQRCIRLNRRNALGEPVCKCRTLGRGLAAFKLPFGSLRVSPSDYLATRFPERIKRDWRNKPIKHEYPPGTQSYTVQYEINLKDMELGDLIMSDRGISYLDWLVGQDWIYGNVKKYVSQMLIKIAPQVDALFPDHLMFANGYYWDDDSRKPVFSPALQADQDRWHGSLYQTKNEQIPSELMSIEECWEFIADTIIALESMTDVHDFLDLDKDRLHRAIQAIGAQGAYDAIRDVREAYRTCRLRLTAVPSTTTGQAHTVGTHEHQPINNLVRKERKERARCY